MNSEFVFDEIGFDAFEDIGHFVEDCLFLLFKVYILSEADGINTKIAHAYVLG